MTRIQKIEREIADIKHQMDAIDQKETQQKRSGFFGLIILFIIGFILGIGTGYLLLT
jgi:hypothetical protein